jgi:hypothetical protein
MNGFDDFDTQIQIEEIDFNLVEDMEEFLKEFMEDEDKEFGEFGEDDEAGDIRGEDWYLDQYLEDRYELGDDY